MTLMLYTYRPEYFEADSYLVQMIRRTIYLKFCEHSWSF